MGHTKSGYRSPEAIDEQEIVALQRLLKYNRAVMRVLIFIGFGMILLMVPGVFFLDGWWVFVTGWIATSILAAAGWIYYIQLPRISFAIECYVMTLEASLKDRMPWLEQDLSFPPLESSIEDTAAIRVECHLVPGGDTNLGRRFFRSRDLASR